MLTKSKAQDEAIAGFLAGFVSTVSLHPLDLIKTRLQVTESTFKSFIPTVKDIYSTARIKGFYQGMSPNLLGAASSWGIYFFWYSHLKQSLQKEKDEKLKPHEHLFSSALAGLLTSLVTNPIWVVKTRMFTQSPTDPLKYKNVFDGLIKLRKEGIKGYYRGIVPAMFGVSHGAIQFMTYEQLKIYFNTDSTFKYIGLACLSKVIATVVTYPYQVVKSRMQTEQRILHGKYDGVLGTIKTIYTKETSRGFYKGMGVNLIRVLPGTCITFAVYESLSKYFQSL